MSLVQAVATLEKEVAFLRWVLWSSRVTPRESAIYYNGLAHRRWIGGERPKYGIECRIENLEQEIATWRSKLEQMTPGPAVDDRR